MSTVLRFLFLIPIGFVLACLAASFALLWPFVRLEPANWGDPFTLFELGVGFFAQSAQVGSTALLPWFAFMAITESLGLRSLLLHAGAGLAGAALALHKLVGWLNADDALRVAFAMAGLAFALVYWGVAGHRAGRWRRREQRPTSP